MKEGQAESSFSQEEIAELVNLLGRFEKRHRSEAIKRGLQCRKDGTATPKVKSGRNLFADIHIEVWSRPPREGLMGFGSCIYNNAIYLDLLGIYFKKELGFYLVYPKKIVDDRTFEVHAAIGHKAIKELEDAIVGKYLELVEGTKVR